MHAAAEQGFVVGPPQWWTGGLGTVWQNDPNVGLVARVLTQSAGFLFADALPAFWSAVYDGFSA